MFFPENGGEGFPVEPDQASAEGSPVKEPGDEGRAVVNTRAECVEESLWCEKRGGSAE